MPTQNSPATVHPRTSFGGQLVARSQIKWHRLSVITAWQQQTNFSILSNHLTDNHGAVVGYLDHETSNYGYSEGSTHQDKAFNSKSSWQPICNDTYPLKYPVKVNILALELVSEADSNSGQLWQEESIAGGSVRNAPCSWHSRKLKNPEKHYF